MAEQNSRKIRLIHFNDVYNIQEQQNEPVGGAARFTSAVNSKKQDYGVDNCLTLFSGDAYSPSMMSSLYDGVQMIKALNSAGIDVACMGNHELDYTLEEIISLTKQNNFDWLLSNVYNSLLEQNLAETLSTKIIYKNGIKIGVMGLAEEEWLGVITSIDPNIIDYEDFIECAKRLVYDLKEIEKCDLIIALTHMRNPNDILLAQNVPQIDLILGGHDHIKHNQLLNNGNTLFLKSGTDFQMFSYSDLEDLGVQDKIIHQSDIENQVYVIKNRWKLSLNFVEITKEIEPDQEMAVHVKYYSDLCQKEMQKVIGYLDCELDTRFKIIRTQENQFGNFYADLCRIEMDSEICLLNTGTIRADFIFDPGFINFDMLMKLLPIQDTIIVVEINGKQLHEALENSVSKYPGFDGRFASTSNIEFKFDASQKPMQRIKKEDITVVGQPIDYERSYSCAMKYFLSIGKDGYDVLKQCKPIVDEERGTPHLNIIKSFFSSYKREQQNLTTMNSFSEIASKRFSCISPPTESNNLSKINSGIQKEEQTKNRSKSDEEEHLSQKLISDDNVNEISRKTQSEQIKDQQQQIKDLDLNNSDKKKQQQQQQQKENKNCKRSSILFTRQGSRRATMPNQMILDLQKKISTASANSNNNTNSIQTLSNNASQIQPPIDSIKEEIHKNSKYAQYQKMGLIHGFKYSEENKAEVISIKPQVGKRIVVINPQE